MINLSSNFTLMFKIFLPTLWLAFFGAAIMAFLFADISAFEHLPIFVIRSSLLLFLLGGIVFFYFTFFRLKRVEADKEFLYITNYFKTARYPFHNVEKIEEVGILLFPIMKVYLKKGGVFGTKIPFIASKKRMLMFIEKFPNIAKDIITN